MLASFEMVLLIVEMQVICVLNIEPGAQLDWLVVLRLRDLYSDQIPIFIHTSEFLVLGTRRG